MLFILWGGALLYILIFRNAAFIHDYYKIYFAPALALSAFFAISGVESLHPKIHRFASPVIGGVVVSSIVIGIVVFSLWHQAGQQGLDTIVVEIAAQSDPDENILTNLNDSIVALAFYSERTIHSDVTPEQALKRLKNKEAKLYVFCSDNKQIPDIFSGIAYEYEGDCFYIPQPS